MPARAVLTQSDIERALTRIAHEILESDRAGSGEGGAPLVLLGIPTRGVLLAERLARLLDDLEPGWGGVGALDVTMYRDDLSRQPTRSPQPTRIPDAGIDGATVILVDDVLYSGRTIRAALDAIGDLGRPRTVRLAALVDRGHRDLPIRADFVGKNLPTARTERIFVRLTPVDAEDGVWIEEGSR